MLARRPAVHQTLASVRSDRGEQCQRESSFLVDPLLPPREPRRLDQLPDAVVWAPLVGNPLVRRTWAVWSASSRRRDIGHFVTTFDSPDDG